MNQTKPIDMDSLYPEPYCVVDNCLCRKEFLKGNPEPRISVLCNFVPFIETQVLCDNGDKTTARLIVSGIAEDGRRLPKICVEGAEFPGLTWVSTQWGYENNIAHGQATRDKIRFAIQATAKYAEKVNVYSVTGWKLLGGKIRFLLPGDDEYEVELPGKMSGYGMRREYTEEDVKVLIEMLSGKLVPNSILYPLLAFVFLSPLTSFLREIGCEPKTVPILLGRTGSKKSTLAALMLSFFGNFTASTLPLSFKDTPKNIIHHSYTLKDVLTCIDDFHPSGKVDAFSMTATAQTVMRAYGDRVGRGKLKANSEPMESRFPQGNAIITAEYPPDIGESGTARCFMIEMKVDSIDNDTLSFFQEKASAGVLSSCMFAYTEWLIGHCTRDGSLTDEWKKKTKETFRAERDGMLKRLRKNGVICHARIPEDTSVMKIGFEHMIRFMEAHGLLNDEEAEIFLLDFDDEMYLAAERLCKNVEDDKPVVRFLCKLNSLLECGRFYLAKRDSGVIDNSGKCLGFVDGQNMYLYKSQAHQAVKKMCDEQGESFSVSEKSLIKALDAEGIINRDKNQFTKTVHVAGKNMRLLEIPLERFREVVEKCS